MQTFLWQDIPETVPLELCEKEQPQVRLFNVCSYFSTCLSAGVTILLSSVFAVGASDKFKLIYMSTCMPFGLMQTFT